MKQISHWSHQNPNQARLLILVGQIVLGVEAGLLGTWLQMEGYQMGQTLLLLGVGAYFVALVCYPLRIREATQGRAFVRRKICDAVAVVCSFVCWMGLANWAPTHEIPLAPTTTSTLTTTARTTAAADTRLEHYTLLEKIYHTKVAREVRGKYRHAAQWLEAKAAGASKFELFLLGALIVLGTALLLVLLAYAACGLACSDQGVLAVLVLLAGVCLIVWLNILAWRAWMRRKRALG